MSPGARATMNLVVLVLIGLRAGAAWPEVTVTPHVLSHPDFSADSPFKPFDEASSAALTAALHAAADSPTPCPMAAAARNFPAVRGNVCNAAEAARIRDVLAGVAPSLDPARFAFWKVDLDDDARPELVAAYSLAAAGERDGGAPYLAIWLMTLRTARYEVRYAGTYLAGQVHAVTRFGPARTKVLFVRSQNCMECRPGVYLHAVTFPVEGPPAAFFEFTYAGDHSAFDRTIEYSLPGHGHSMDATIETRVPAPERPWTPHLIQLFRLGGGRSEWWLFRCNGLRCDYERHPDRLPGQHLRAWLRAERL